MELKVACAGASKPVQAALDIRHSLTAVLVAVLRDDTRLQQP